MTKVAVFDLTGCQGCEFHLLSLNEQLLDIFQNFEITNWRLLSQDSKNDFDIAIIEGAVTTKEHIKLLKEIRETSKVVIAIGACAISGNFFAELTPDQRKKLAPKIYDEKYRLKAEFLEPVEKYIKVDEKIPGCPPNLEIFKKTLIKYQGKEVTSKIKDVVPPDYVAKIEGHGQLKINFKQKKVEFEVEESERLIEGLLLGKNFSQAPVINSRICGICPVAHNLCSWKAIEDALGVEPAPEAIILRELMSSAQLIKSHLVHLFFLVLPDFANLKSALDLSQRYPAEFHLMLNIKRVSERVLEVVAGSTAFPVNTTLGGFVKPPKLDGLLSLRELADDVIDEAQDLVNLFASFTVPPIDSSVEFLSIKPPHNEYPLYKSVEIPQVKESLKDGSTAKLGLVNNQVVKVGALSRISRYQDCLRPLAKEIFESHPFELRNPYHNNLAQAVEVLHFLDKIRFLVGELINKDLSKTKGRSLESWLKDKKSQDSFYGEACLEAPRGVLIHQVKLNKTGKIIDYNIIPPTQINLASLEVEARQLVKERNGSDEELERETEMLIRAFDPCITCAVH
ncbi:nickel-dependent hydrogenase large subunit [Patescibacteria group bacterium]